MSDGEVAAATPSPLQHGAAPPHSQPQPQPAPQLQPPLIPARYFADRPVIANASLSPDGSKIAFLKDVDDVAQFVLADPFSGATIATQFMPEGFDIVGYIWTDNATLLVEGIGIIRRDRYRYKVRKLYLAMPQANYVRPLIADPFLSSSARVVRVDEDGDWALVAHKDEQKAKYPSVYRYDLRSSAPGELVQEMIEGVSFWSADEAGVVRLGQGFRGGRAHVWYRSDASAQFSDKGRAKPGDDDSIYGAMRFKSGSDVSPVIARGDQGQIGLYRFDFSTMKSLETIYENPNGDVSGLWYTDDEPRAVFYIDDARQVAWLSEADNALHAELISALGGNGMRLVYPSVSKDGTRRLIAAGNASDPGVLYFFDSATLAMNELAELRPNLDYTQLAKPKPIEFTARDGVDIHGYLTLPRGRAASGLPLIILPHGGPFGVRDLLRYDDWVQFLANRGYAVLQPNYRGSGGYGDAFYDLGVGEVGRAMQDDLDDAMDWAVAQGIADPARVCIVGGSYGGYAALWGVLRNPERYRCAASWAGVTDWDRMLRYDRKFLSGAARRRWQEKVEGENADLKDVSPARLAGRLSRPVLLAHGTRDFNVPFEQFAQMVKAAKNAPIPLTPVVVHGAGHSFSTQRHHLQWLDALDQFLALHNPADQVDEKGELLQPDDPELDAFFTPLVVEQP